MRYDGTMDESTRWLTDDEQRAWRAFLLATHLLMDQLDRELQRDAGLSHADYGVLVALSEAPGRALRMSDLASLQAFSRSRLSHAVGRMEARGWVTRRACPTDKRGAFAVLTDAGFAALAAAAPGHVAGIRRHLFDRLSPAQVGQLRALAEAVAEPLLATAEGAVCSALCPDAAAPSAFDCAEAPEPPPAGGSPGDEGGSVASGRTR